MLHLLFAFLLTTLLQSDSGSTYYVSTTGNDGNAGTEQAPWQTIQTALDYPGLEPGDTIALMPGRYEEAVRVTRSGAPGAPITIRSHDPAAPAILTHATQDVMTIADQSHIVIEGLHFEGWSCGGIQIWAMTQSMIDITVTDNVLRDNKSWDVCGLGLHVIVAGTARPEFTLSNVTIQRNLLQNVISGKPTAYNENITFIGNVRKSQIVENRIENGSYIGIDLIGRLYTQADEDPRYHDYGQPQEILIKGNVIDYLKPPENGGTPVGIYLDGALRAIVIEENEILHASGIYLNTEWTAAQAGNYLTPTHHVIVRRNKVELDANGSYALAMGFETWQNGDECFAYAHDSVAVHNTFVVDGAYRTNLFMCGEKIAWKNNIFVHNNPELANFHDVYRSSIQATQLVLEGNLYYSATKQQQYKYPPDQAFGSLVAWQQGTEQDQQARFASPRFQNPEARDYTLGPGSAATDAGAALTHATNTAQQSTVLTVANAVYFSDGLGLQPGDLIRVGLPFSAKAARVVEVDHERNQLLLDRPISWQAGDPIHYDYHGAGPDIGAFEARVVDWPLFFLRLIVSAFQ